MFIVGPKYITILQFAAMLLIQYRFVLIDPRPKSTTRHGARGGSEKDIKTKILKSCGFIPDLVWCEMIAFPKKLPFQIIAV